MPKPALRPVPEGMSTITPHLWFSGNGREAIAFYQKAFAAEIVGAIAAGADGKSVMHAMIRIGNSNLMLADSFSETGDRIAPGNATVGMWLYVDDCDALFQRATAAGCQIEMPMMDAFWGDRLGKLKDPFGHPWFIASRRYELTPEEIQERQREFLASLNR